MITLFNRKELYATFSTQQQAAIRDILDQNGIDYSIKTINRNSPSAFNDSRVRTGTLGQNMQQAYEYIVYVRTKDFDAAMDAINKKNV